MRFRESVKIAVDSILSNKLRSFLTMLGIIIGISSVITILSLGEGGRAYITDTFEEIGATTIEVRVTGQELRQSDYFTQGDIDYLKSTIPDIKYATPVTQTRGSLSTPRGRSTAVLSAGSQDLRHILNLEFLEGRFFTASEDREGRGVLVLDENGALQLFGRTRNVVGEMVDVTLRNTVKRVQVVGVIETLNPLAGSSNFGGNIPLVGYFPYGTYLDMFPDQDTLTSFFVSSSSKETTDQVATSIVSRLRIRKNAVDRDIYQANSFLSTLDQVNSIITLFTTFIGAVAAISLVVGGIGVMNIMLVSVTERTREIGIRKAIGATTSNILFQFLTESVIIALIGGILGMTLGIGLAILGGRFVGIVPILSIAQIIGVMVFSSAIGIFFGLYPARKAAAMHPIDALRYE